jgi:hypothetical protein
MNDEQRASIASPEAQEERLVFTRFECGRVAATR